MTRTSPFAINLDHLRAFARVAELGSFTKAADALGLAQSSVSRIVGELEAEWSGALFYRTGRGVELSNLGQEALKKIQSLLSDFDQISDEMIGRSRLPYGSVAVALPHSLVSSFLPKLFTRIQKEKPEVKLRVYEGSSAQIERWLTDGVVDIGFYSDYRVEGRIAGTKRSAASSKGTAIKNFPVMLAGPVNQRPLPRAIDFKRLAEFPLVLPAPTRGMREIVDTIAKRMAVTLQIVAEADSVFAQEALTLECGCYMLRSTMPVENIDKKFSACTIRNPSIYRHIVLATAQKKSLGRAARELVALSESILAGR